MKKEYDAVGTVMGQPEQRICLLPMEKQRNNIIFIAEIMHSFFEVYRR